MVLRVGEPSLLGDSNSSARIDLIELAGELAYGHVVGVYLVALESIGEILEETAPCGC